MKKLMTAAIFVMAMMMSATFAFGQSNSDNAPLMNFTVHINAVNPTNNIDYVVENATITYRWRDAGNGGDWTDWNTRPSNTLTPDWITFWVDTYSYTNSQIVEIDYVLRGYSGSTLVHSHCATSVVTNGCTLTVTSWNYCLKKAIPVTLPDQNTTD